MTGEELRAIRMQLNMNLHEFGLWLTAKMNADKPPEEQVTGYSRHRVHDWESGRVAVPDKIENMFLKDEITRLQEELSLRRKLPRQQGQE